MLLLISATKLKIMSEVCRILRVVGYLKHAQRYYAVRRGQNYYEILGVKNDASRKDIRAAFLNISKQVHPDTGNKTGHTEFIKLTEAYNVLSKDSTRKEYDAKLSARNQLRYTSYHPVGRTYYGHRESHSEHWRADHLRRKGGGPFATYDRTHFESGDPKNVSKTTIVLLCVLLSAVGFSLQILAVVYSPTLDREKMLERSARYSAELEKLRERAKRHRSVSESIDSFLNRVDGPDE
ncbi:dnaJ homolog subfamily C member 4 [Diachasma alloeum]|uniref:dnaJ homolog subfamily C member 4 n=1 Tax=Diachasma alloeum TaxID=454923 RepID=UPI0007382E38|nr:dnaJ homolog subfamily C member 4 [Diachasma alloeum]